jgi:hypothetical protein
MNLLDLTVPYDPTGNDWNDDGVVVLDNFMPDDLMDAYAEAWKAANSDRPGGWPHCTPYRTVPALADILAYGPLHEVMADLVGEPVGVHLNLTGWKSTTRNWHQDSYLNPPGVGDFYIAAWIALDTIHPDSGPFQYVPGSHKWPQVTRDKILAALEPDERNHMWPTHSERILTPLFEDWISTQGVEPVSYLPSRGDVLLWHGRLLHRGSTPTDQRRKRRSLIAHYSGIHHRSDMPPAYQHGAGWAFPVDDTSMASS